MAGELSERQMEIEDLSSDLRRTGYVFFPLIFLGAVAVAFKSGFGAVSGTYLMWALSCLMSGGVLGFLFGIPKILQADQPAGPARTSTAYRQQVNTNLEQISDWLTKIIVGLGLINLPNIPPYLSRMAHALSSSAGAGENPAFAAALIVYFALLGFLFGYLSTRLFLAGAFSKADQLAAALSEGKSRGAEQTVKQLKALARELEPRLFKQVLNEIQPEAFIVGEVSRGARQASSNGQAPPVEAEEADSDLNERESLEHELDRIVRGGN